MNLVLRRCMHSCLGALRGVLMVVSTFSLFWCCPFPPDMEAYQQCENEDLHNPNVCTAIHVIPAKFHIHCFRTVAAKPSLPRTNQRPQQHPTHLQCPWGVLGSSGSTPC
jgi:hypothetical protein